MDIKAVAVVGSGVMGSGIAHVFALKGFDVLLVDIREDFCKKALQNIEKEMAQQIEQKAITRDEASAALKRIHTSISLDNCREVDFIVEAVTENYKIKRDVFTILDEICKPEVIFASNTSSISITTLAAATRRPDKFVGMHFMNPVRVKKLVEVIRGLASSEETCQTVFKLVKKLDKMPVEVHDFPGFVSYRILMPMINEAAFCLMEGVARAEDIDTIMKLGMDHPMGPLELADFIGLDVCLETMEVLYRGFRDSKFRPCPLLAKMVAAGYLGRKTGKGFYNYS
ncbi:MAG: 3-hydroxybutyryl-CoA dehydrogenase [Calditrichia bacterium]